ncbi:MAG: hypothetical protein AAGG68_22785 [Bacteroidota bacterium]
MKLYPFVFLFTIFACNNATPTTSTEVSTETENENQAESKIKKNTVVKQQVELKKSLNTTFKDYKIEAKVADGALQMAANNPKGNAIEMSDIPLEGELKFVEATDMNGDGRPEICVVEKTATGEKLHACSLTPFSALPIHLPSIKLTDFQGDDAYMIEDGQLMRSYTTTKGKQAKIEYNLVAGEAGFRFEPHGIRADEMDGIVFGTYITAGYPKDYDYWQKLTISDNGLGEIIINITAIQTENGRPVCSFESIGRLVAGKITAPLNFKVENIEGTMVLTQIQNGWKIDIEQEKNRPNLMYFCRGDLSLAGEYLRSK